MHQGHPGVLQLKRTLFACALLGLLVGCAEKPTDHLQRARDAIYEKNPDEALVEYRKASICCAGTSRPSHRC